MTMLWEEMVFFTKATSGLEPDADDAQRETTKIDRKAKPPIIFLAISNRTHLIGRKHSLCPCLPRIKLYFLVIKYEHDTNKSFYLFLFLFIYWSWPVGHVGLVALTDSGTEIWFSWYIKMTLQKSDFHFHFHFHFLGCLNHFSMMMCSPLMSFFWYLVLEAYHSWDKR